MIVEAIRLQQVDDIEAVEAASPRIPQTEVIPLTIALCQIIGLENQIVLEHIDLDGTPQVTALEAGLKLQRIVSRARRLVRLLEISTVVAIRHSVV